MTSHEVKRVCFRKRKATFFLFYQKKARVYKMILNKSKFYTFNSIALHAERRNLRALQTYFESKKIIFASHAPFPIYIIVEIRNRISEVCISNKFLFELKFTDVKARMFVVVKRKISTSFEAEKT